MPDRKFALEPDGPKRLRVVTGVFSTRCTIYLDGDLIGEITDAKELKKGRSFTLPDGSKLSIRQRSNFFTNELQIYHNGQPIPGSDSDPEQQLKMAWQMIFVLAGLNIALGVFFLLSRRSSIGTLEFDSVGLIIAGIIYAVLGFFVRKGSMIALGLAVGGFVIDTIGILLLALVGPGPLVARFFLLMPMLRGFGAIRKLQQQPTVEKKSGKSTGKQNYQSYLDMPETKRSGTKKGILEDFTRLELALAVTLGLVVVLALGVIAGLFISSRNGQNAALVPTQAPMMRPTLPSTWTPTPTLAGPTATSTIPPPSPIIRLPFRVTDADYSLSLDRIVMISGLPNQLTIYDPAAQTGVAVVLPSLPRSVAVSPDGKFAAVGQDTVVSYVDLSAASVINNLVVSYPANDVQLSDDAHVYIASDDSPNHHLIDLDLETGEEAFGDVGYRIRSLELSASGNDLYYIGYELSMVGHTDELSRAPLAVRKEWGFYNYTYPRMCSELFLSADAQRMFFSCGSVLRTSSNPEIDFEEAGRLEGFDGENRIQHLTHSQAAGKVLALLGGNQLPTNSTVDSAAYSNRLMKYKYDPLGLEDTITLPDFVANDTAYPAYGRYVFVNAAGTDYYVIVQADSEAGMLQDQGLIIGHLNNAEFVRPLQAQAEEIAALPTSAANTLGNFVAPSLVPEATWTTFVVATPIPSATPITSSGIQLSAPMKKVIFDDVANMAYGLDAANRKLLVIDLQNKQVKITVALTTTPSDACVNQERRRLYIVNWETTFVTEYDLDTLQWVNDIFWPAPENFEEWNADLGHYHIYCQPDRLVLVDATGGPRPWVLDLTDARYPSRTFQAEQMEIGSSFSDVGIGDLAFGTDANEFYFWHQWGWDAGYSGSDVMRARLDVSGDTMTIVDDAEMQPFDMEREPLDTPVFFDAATNRVIVKKLVMNALDLKQIYYTFPIGEDIYAVDWAHNRAASKHVIYDLETFQPVANLGGVGIDQLHFAPDGTLYLLSNQATSLSMIKPP